MTAKYNAAVPRWNNVSIQALRRHLGVTQQALAEQMGTRQQTISEWETGMYQPRGASLKLLNLIAEKSEFEYQTGTTNQQPK